MYYYYLPYFYSNWAILTELQNISKQITYKAERISFR